MKSNTIFTKALLSLIMALLLCFPKVSLEGARTGLLLWYGTVLPTLLPFMVCTNLLISINAVNFITAPIAPVLSRLLGLSKNGCFVLLNGALCGYPMGAKSCSDFLDQGSLSPEEARCLYAVSSFPSPMFLAGFVMAKAALAAGQRMVPFWKLALSIYLPVIPMFFLASGIYHFPGSHLHSFRPAGTKPCTGPGIFSLPKAPVSSSPGILAPAPGLHPPRLSLDEALMSSIEVMVKIGGYLMIFSILASFLKRLLPSGLLRTLLIAAAEMTTGIQEISLTVPGFSGVRLILAAAAFGGLSGIFQVKSVTKNVGLSIRHYTLWKIIHGLSAWGILTLLEAYPH